MPGRFFALLGSTIAAFFGVQTEARRRQDFNNTSPVPYILMGILLACCLVASLLWLVSTVLAQ